MTGGGADAFVMKLNSSGAIQWVTQLGDTTTAAGGSNSGSDSCEGVAVDGGGNVYCAGVAYYSDLGEVNGGFGDAFVMKLNSDGAIQWVTQLGDTTTAAGGDNSGWDTCEGVAVDDDGNVYCAGKTSGDLSEGNGGGGSDDAFVMKLNSSGAIQWVTQLGATTKVDGGENSGSDICKGVTVDDSGNVYCAGYTGGDLGEANAGSMDVFVMKLNSSGVTQWVTQLGATTKADGGDNSGFDICSDVAVDGSGNVYCAGYTAGDLGEVNGGGTDAFVMKLNSDGTF